MDEAEDDHDDCAFCLGRVAAHRGEPETTNPFTRTHSKIGSSGWYESDFGLWETGYGVGASEPGGVPWYAKDIAGGTG